MAPFVAVGLRGPPRARPRQRRPDTRARRRAATIPRFSVSTLPHTRLGETNIRRPGPDARLQTAFEAFAASQVQWVAPDALLLGWYTRDEPETQARAAEPPISRHDARGIGFCTPPAPLPDAHQRP